MIETRSIFLLFASMLLLACTTYDEKRNLDEPGALDLILCAEPRPQICTREYKPVCATLHDHSTKTDSTACTACSDAKVLGYIMGSC